MPSSPRRWLPKTIFDPEWFEVVGELENHATAPSAYTQVTGTFQDADGKVIYVGSKCPDGMRPRCPFCLGLSVSPHGSPGSILVSDKKIPLSSMFRRVSVSLSLPVSGAYFIRSDMGK
jgi:hypothetical protein